MNSLSCKISSSPSGYMSEFQNILSEGKEPIMTKEYKPKVANTFDTYLDPKSLKEYVLRSERMQKIIEMFTNKVGGTRAGNEELVRQILNEIGLGRNLCIIRWCGVAITAIGKRISSGIYINEKNLQRVKDSIGRNPVLYLPSHRSYLDFILMSYICFHYEIEIPGIAAGMDFHEMFAIGKMLRKTGAFFMRRTFSSDQLYWEVFRQYIYTLVANYHIGIEFFLEGTRSRNFKALPPKIGLLSMAIFPFLTGEVSDITLVPISISYERVLEEQLFIYELLGIPKPKESTKGFFKALKVIGDRFGKMYIDFGEPISLRNFCKDTKFRFYRAGVPSHLQKLNQHDIDLVKRIASEVVYRQQRRIVITTFNLICLYYAYKLYCGSRTSIDELSIAVIKLKTMFEFLDAHVATDEDCIKTDITETLGIHSNMFRIENNELHLIRSAASTQIQNVDTSKLKAHALMPQTIAIAVPSFALQLYINPCMLWLAYPAFLILAITKRKSEYFDSKFSLWECLRKDVTELESIFQLEFIINSVDNNKEIEKCFKFLQTFEIVKSQEEFQIDLNQNELFSIIISSISPFLFLYYHLASTLNEIPLTQEFTAKEAIIKIQQRIEKYLIENNQKFVHPYCLSVDTLNIGLQSFVQNGILEKNRDTQMLSHYKADSGFGYNIELRQLEDTLLEYCKISTFTRYYEAYNGDWLPAKL